MSAFRPFLCFNTGHCFHLTSVWLWAGRGPGGVLYETAPVGVITLTSEAASVIWGAFKFNLGHTPGYESVEVKKLHQIKVLLLVWASVDFKPEVLTALPYLQSLCRCTTAPGYNTVYLMLKLAGNLMSNIPLDIKWSIESCEEVISLMFQL